jgi:geranylgeranyl diphosphate synthase type I
MRTEVLAGQYLDVLHQSTGDGSPEAALRVCRYKTAAYTVQRPLLLGGALADAPATQLAAYEAFGSDIGVAFQLRDDLLGVFGDPEVTGKPAGDDLREGKRTYLVALALRRAEETGNPGAAQAVTAALRAPDLDADAVARARAALVELGAVAAVERRIEDLVAAAVDRLAGAGLARPAADRLGELAVLATRRAA